MLDKLPLEVVVRIGELGRWHRETFLALSQVSTKYQTMVQRLCPYAQRFDLRFYIRTNADAVSLETIAHQWFTN